MKTDEKKLLHENAPRFGTFLTEEQIDSLCLFIDLLVEWNSKINLVGTSDRVRIINELLLDSMVHVPYLPFNGKMVDLGSGAGFPALIIKIIKPDLKVKLVESNSKKVSFLKYVIHKLKLTDISPVNGRVEALTESIRSWECNIVISRAMTSLYNVIRLSDPFLGPGSIVAGFMGRDGTKDLKNIKKLLSNYNLVLKESITYHLLENKTKRTAVILQKMPISDA